MQFMNSVLAGLAALLLAVSPVLAVVVRDGPPQNEVGPLENGEVGFPLDDGEIHLGLNSDAVVNIFITVPNDPFTVQASGVLLDTGRHVLTAAHIFDGLPGNAQINMSMDVAGFDPSFNEVLGGQVHLPDGPNQYKAGPQRLLNTDQPPPQTSWFGGWDIAIIELSALSIEEVRGVKGNRIVTPDLGANEVNEEVWISGYGFRGNGINGITTNPLQTKVVGKNEWEGEFNPADEPTLTNTQHMIFYDFDSGAGNRNFIGTAGLGQDEVLHTFGDSGGPHFIQVGDEFVVAGVSSWGRGGMGQTADSDGSQNGTFGEIGIATRILGDVPGDGTPNEIYQFIQGKIGDRDHIEQGAESSLTPNWENGSLWSGGTAPSSGQTAVFNRDLTSVGALAIQGPASSVTIAGLEVGKGVGLKRFDFSRGGTVIVNGNVRVEDNGSIVHRVGDLSMDRLIIQGLPGANGQFFWTDASGPTNSSLTVNRVEIRNGGDFIHDWFDTSAGTLSAQGGGNVDLDVQRFGRAFFQFNSPGVGQITNHGLVSLGETSIGNQVFADSFDQSAGGALGVFIAGNGVATANDRLAVSGAAALAGGLIVNPFDAGFQQDYNAGDTLTVLTAASITGGFDFFSGLQIDNTLRWDVGQTSNAVTLTAVNLIAGDMNGDGVANAADLPFFVLGLEDALTYGGTVGLDAAIMGDLDGDADFDLDDVRLAADTLTITGGTGVNRKQNYIDIDEALDILDDGLLNGSDDNFFNVLLATGLDPVWGDARGDIAGAGAVYGADGVVDNHDVDFLFDVINAVQAGDQAALDALLGGALAGVVDMDGDGSVGTASDIFLALGLNEDSAPVGDDLDLNSWLASLNTDMLSGQAFLAPSINTVPEPGTVVLLGLFFLAGIRTRCGA